LDAYVGALARTLEFVLDELLLMALNHSPEVTHLLEDLWQRGWKANPHLERSLRYLVQERSGKEIDPSEQESQYAPRPSPEPLRLLEKGLHPAEHFHLGDVETPLLWPGDLQSWTRFDLETLIDRTVRRVFTEIWK
jgi:hypothetical protein